MLRKSLALSILVSILVLSFSILTVAQTNTGEGSTSPVDLPSSRQGNIAPAAIMFDLSPGTGPPPATLGGFTMTPVPFPGAPACTGIAPPSLPTPGGPIGITPWVDSRCIGSGWSTWSHGYSGDVYFSNGSTSQSVTLPAGTRAVYFYVEPNPFAVHNFEVIADGVSSGIFSADGSGGARYVGVYNPSGTVNNIRINCEVDFASGEYGWAGGEVCTGAISGVVTDPGGAGLQAIVIAIKLPPPPKAFAIADPKYLIPDLPEGPHLVICFKKGYKPAFKIVQVKCDTTAIADFVLSPAE